MSASRGWLPAGALVLIVVAGGWWLLVGSDRSASTAVTTGVTSRQAGDASTRLPVADAPQSAVLLIADEPTPTASAETPAAGVTVVAALLAGVPVRLTGRVVDGRGVPVTGAAVLYRATSPMRDVFRADADKSLPDVDFMPRVLTDAAGRFTLESRHLPAPDWDWDGTYPFVIALGEGCAPRSVRCLGCAGGEFDTGDICIEPGGWLTGRVVDERGAPLLGARIWGHDLHEQPAGCVIAERDSVFDDHVSECAGGIAGPDGRFRAGPFWPGTAGLKAEAPGYVEQLVAAQPIDVGHDVDVGDIVVARGRVLSGIVLAPDGTPVPGARVHAWRPNGPAILDQLDDVIDKVAWSRLGRFRDRELTTNESGRFELGGFESANYRIQVEVQGFEWWEVDNVLPGTGELRIELAPAARLELQLVEDATDAPAAGALVTAGRRLREKEYGSVPLTVTPCEEPGVFIIEPLGPGGTDVHVSAAGLSGASLHVDALKPGVVERRTLRLVPAFVVPGMVTTPDGTPLPGTDVVAETLPADADAKVRPQEEPPPSVSVRTGTDGRFTLSGLEPGRWSVKADRDDCAPDTQDITVEAGKQPEDMTLVLQPSCTLFGVLTDGQGKPEVGERIWARSPRGGDWPEVRSDVGGRYEFKDLVPGSWSLRYAPDEIVLAPGDVRRVDLQDAMQTVLEGHVLLADGSPPARAVVYCCSREESGLERRLIPVHTDGSFRSEGSAPGAYMLQALLDDGAGQSPIVTVTTVEHQATTVDLRVGGERVRVHVTDQSSGQPAAGVHIALLPVFDDGEPAGSGRVRFNGERRNFGGATDAHGVVELGGLPPGRLRVMLPDPAFGLASSEPLFAEVRAGEVTDVEIAVVGYASVSGSIARSDGVPARDGLYVMGFGKASYPPLSITSSGKYHLDELPPGSWRIVVSADWMEDVGDAQAQRLVDITVTLEPGQQLDLPLTIRD